MGRFRTRLGAAITLCVLGAVAPPVVAQNMAMPGMGAMKQPDTPKPNQADDPMAGMDMSAPGDAMAMKMAGAFGPYSM